MAEHIGSLAGTFIPLVDEEGENKKFDGEKFVHLNIDGKIDEEYLPDDIGDGFSGDYNDLSNLPALHPVATSGNYTQLNSRPALSAVALSGDYDDLTNKPTGPGGSEDNTILGVLITSGSLSVEVESILQFLIVRPAADLAAFKVGILADDDLYLPTVPVTSAKWTVFTINEYLESSTDIQFAGITSSTEIKIVFKPIHNAP